MDLSTFLGWLVAFGAGGIVTNWFNTATDRRRGRADLLTAQRELSAVDYHDLETFDAAVEKVRLQAMVAGVPTWLLRQYGAIAGLEAGERHRERDLGPEEFAEYESVSQYEEFPKIPRQQVAALYEDTELKFNWGIWHPMLIHLASPLWRFKFYRFWNQLGFRSIRKEDTAWRKSPYKGRWAVEDHVEVPMMAPETNERPRLLWAIGAAATAVVGWLSAYLLRRGRRT